MRLLKVSSVTGQGGPVLKDVPADEIPAHPFAILSHTWGKDEVIFPDIQNGTARAKTSFKKIAFTCRQAEIDGLEWAWIDSCCIDKSSSAELSEAINSMFSWYTMASRCYALLEDHEEPEFSPAAFKRCRWFTRGWTLQELLAPARIMFYSASEVLIGTSESLSQWISEVTQIDREILAGAVPLTAVSVAKRMSWASKRETTRREDMAYCLLGIFDVNMPMLYGEGDKAFMRLQEEIMKKSDDESLFAWCDVAAGADTYHGLLAKSPRCFAASRSFVTYQDWQSRVPYQMTNRGLHITLPIVPTAHSPRKNLFVAALNCPAPPDYRADEFLGLYLEMLPGAGDHYARVKVGEFARVHAPQGRESIYVRQNFDTFMIDDMQVLPQHAVQLRGGPSKTVYPSVTIIALTGQSGRLPPLRPNWASHPQQPDDWRTAREWWRSDTTRQQGPVFRMPKAPGKVAGGVLFKRNDGRRILVLLGSEKLFTVGFCAIELPSALAGAPEIEPNELQPLFDMPQRMGTEVKLRENLVRVDSLSMVDGLCKYVLVDIRMEPVEGAGSGSDREGEELYSTASAEPQKRKESRWKRVLTFRSDNAGH